MKVSQMNSMDQQIRQNKSPIFGKKLATSSFSEHPHHSITSNKASSVSYNPLPTSTSTASSNSKKILKNLSKRDLGMSDFHKIKSPQKPDVSSPYEIDFYQFKESSRMASKKQANKSQKQQLASNQSNDRSTSRGKSGSKRSKSKTSLKPNSSHKRHLTEPKISVFKMPNKPIYQSYQSKKRCASRRGTQPSMDQQVAAQYSRR